MSIKKIILKTNPPKINERKRNMAEILTGVEGDSLHPTTHFFLDLIFLCCTIGINYFIKMGFRASLIRYVSGERRVWKKNIISREIWILLL